MPSRAAGDAAAAVTSPPIALIAGSGDLPLVIAETLAGKGRDVFVVAVEGETDRDFSAFPHIRLGIGAAARLKAVLTERGCRDVMMAGSFRRPKFSDIRFDLGTLKLAVSTILRLRFGGDDRVVNGVVGIFEAEGFRIVGPQETVPELVAPEGLIGRVRPDRAARADIDIGMQAVDSMAPLDVGQAVIVLDRRLIAVEAAEGTTAMIERCMEMRSARRIAQAPSGLVVKRAKPGQEMRLDMPVIGSETIRAAAAAGLKGIAVEAGRVLVVDLENARKEADEAGLFLVGVRR